MCPTPWVGFFILSFPPLFKSFLIFSCHSLLFLSFPRRRESTLVFPSNFLSRLYSTPWGGMILLPADVPRPLELRRICPIFPLAWCPTPWGGIFIEPISICCHVYSLSPLERAARSLRRAGCVVFLLPADVPRPPELRQP